MKSPEPWYTILTTEMEPHLRKHGGAQWEDLRQEVALRLTRTYDLAPVARARIRTVIRNTAVDMYRKASRRIPVAHLNFEPADPRTQQPAPNLDDLPPSMRALLELRLVHNLHYAEIAEQLGTSIATVKRHVRTARQRLRQIYTPRSLT